MGVEGTHFNIIKAIYNKPTANITLNDEKWKALPLRSESQVCPLFLLLFNVVREAGAKRNKNNGHKA